MTFSTAQLLLDMIRHGNSIEGIRGFKDQPMTDPLVLVNQILYGAPTGTNPTISAEKDRHMAMLSSAKGQEKTVLLYNLGCFSLFLDDVREARQFFTQALALEPSLIEARHNLAYAHELMAEPVEAIRLYEEVLAADPNFQLSRMNLCLLEIQEGNREQGLAELRRMAVEFPENKGLVYHLGTALLTPPNKAQAEETLKLIERLPGWQDYPEFARMRAAALIFAERAPEAMETLNNMIDQNPDDVFALAGLIRAKAQTGAFEGLAVLAQRMDELSPNHGADGLLNVLEEKGIR
ncbi:MAG: hypothetical protein OEV94_03875 [Deltaproteobacteria bacterium]|nr:hypothetical protein [Deltaproteobacteria bacterium]